MKSLLVVLLLVSQTAFSGEVKPLVKLETNFGFFANFREEVTVIDSEGMVVKTTMNRGLDNKPVITKTEVALLSESSVASLTASVNGLDSNLKLEAEPGQGPVIDQGSQTVVVYKNGTEMKIYDKSGGKTYFLQYHSGSGIINLINSLADLN